MAKKKNVVSDNFVPPPQVETTPVEVKKTDITVITYDGKEENKKDCRLIAGKYYKIGQINKRNSGDCYQINDTYYRITSNKIDWNYETNQYDIIENMIMGYVPDKKLIKGYFTPSLKNIMSADDIMIFDENTINVINLKYDFSKGRYSLIPSASSPFVMRNKPTYDTLPTNIYGLGEYPADIVEKLYEGYNQTQFKQSKFDQFLFDYTYGLEIETEGGWFPEKLYYKYGAAPLKDGSILGTEITTIPNNINIDYINQLFTDCSKFTMATQNNSLHVNISGFEASMKFRVALYILYYRLQQEINSFVPIYKRELNYFLSKQGGPKDHCKMMESLGIVKTYVNDNTIDTELDNADKTIFKWLNDGVHDERFNRKSRKHIKQGQPKWEFHSRYYALNMMPLYFGNEKYSRIEFRVHSGTVNKHKALAWILICAAIVKYTELYADRILFTRLKIDFKEIFESVYGTETKEGITIIKFLENYIKIRVDENINKVINNLDIYGKEFVNDNTFAIQNPLFNE